MEGRIVRIALAPVKALGLVHPKVVSLGSEGVRGDRRFWLRDADGRLANGKRFPRLMAVRPDWDEDSRRLSLAFPDGSVVAGTVEPGEPVEATLYDKAHPSRAVPGPWQEALSEFAALPLTLLWSEQGAVDRGATGGGWTSIVSRASLDRLGRKTVAAAPLDGRRFRMLFEIDGVGPHEEDGWLGRRVRVGKGVVRPLGDVGRCAVTSCDPDTGVADLDTLGALAAYRRAGVVERLPFGVYAAVVEPGRVRVGDAVGPV